MSKRFFMGTLPLLLEAVHYEGCGLSKSLSGKVQGEATVSPRRAGMPLLISKQKCKHFLGVGLKNFNALLFEGSAVGSVPLARQGQCKSQKAPEEEAGSEAISFLGKDRLPPQVDWSGEVGGAAFVAGDDVLQDRDLIKQVADLVAGGEVGGAYGRTRFISLGDDLGSTVQAVLLDLQFFAGLIDIGESELSLARLDELIDGFCAGFSDLFGSVMNLQVHGPAHTPGDTEPHLIRECYFGVILVGQAAECNCLLGVGGRQLHTGDERLGLLDIDA